MQNDKLPLIVNIAHSDSPESPCANDGWKVHTFARHKFITDVDPDLYVKKYNRSTGEITPANIGLRRKLEVGLAFWLGCYEHGEIQWALRGEQQSCQFDSTGLAGIIVWEDQPGDLGPKDYAGREADARKFLDTYTKWCNGHVNDVWIDDASGERVESFFECYDEKAMFEEIEGVVKDRPVVVRGDGAWMVKYHGDKLNILKDGEVLGLDTDGTVVCWNEGDELPYNTGETVEEYGSMTQAERKRCGLPETVPV